MLINRKHLDLYQPDKMYLTLDRLLNALTTFEEKSLKGTTVFLSHKHDEEEILFKVVMLLNSLGVKVYLDWQDEEMPSSTCGETALKIKNKIIQNKKFIFLATQKAIESKWCNWELGYGDAKKYDQNIAIMPITDNDGSWAGNEYLQIYPVIKSDYENFKGNYYVEYNSKKINLIDWLKA